MNIIAFVMAIGCSVMTFYLWKSFSNTAQLTDICILFSKPELFWDITLFLASAALITLGFCCPFVEEVCCYLGIGGPLFGGFISLVWTTK